jgi:hypothetical protein
MEFDYKPGKYTITKCVASHCDTIVFVDLDNGQTLSLGGKGVVPVVGDYVMCHQLPDGLKMHIEPPAEPHLRVKDMLEEWNLIGVQRLRRLSYELDGFNHLDDLEQVKIFTGLQNATAVGMFIEQCKFKNAYKHERKFTRAIREVARDLHLLD